MEIHEIKKSLIEACEKGNADLFKIALSSEKVKLGGESKDSFFAFLKERIESAHADVEGNLYHKIKSTNNLKDSTQSYEFFSENHVYSRLSINAKETNNSIHISVLPF